MNRILLLLWLPCLLAGCIGDDIIFDFVEPELRIMNPVDSIGLDQSYQFETVYLNNVGLKEQVSVFWTSSAPDILAIDQNGLATGLQMGVADIMVEYSDGQNPVSDTNRVIVGMSTGVQSMNRTGSIVTTSSYKLEGDFEMIEENGDVILTFADNYAASSALPGLYLYLSNNPNTINNALEVGPVEVFDGAHSYTIKNVGLNDFGYLLYYCKPFNVKVGDGKIN